MKKGILHKLTALLLAFALATAFMPSGGLTVTASAAEETTEDTAAAICGSAGFEKGTLCYKLYTVLEEKIADVAANGGSTVFTFDEDDNMVFTYAGYTSEAAAKSQLSEDLNNCLYCLYFDLPGDLYWYNQAISGKSRSYSSVTEQESDGTYTITATIKSVTFYVLTPYQGTDEDGNTSSTIVDSAAAAKACAVLKTASEVVAQYSSYSDYEKLAAYRDYICSANTYNSSAASSSWDEAAEPDPWQIIYVFDGDADTNVVCEGYAKAFKYLCDLTDFDEDIGCYYVTGTHVSGHAWNIVQMEDGQRYLCDITACDLDKDGTIAAPFFLRGCTVGSAEEGYCIQYEYSYTVGSLHYGYFTTGTSSSLSAYKYKDSMFSLYGTEFLTLAGDDYEPSEEDALYPGIIIDEDLIDLSAAQITLSKTTLTYTGETQRPTVTITLDGKTLKLGTHYVLNFNRFFNAGSGVVTAVGIGDYTGAVSASYAIEPLSIEDDAVVMLSADSFTYDGTAKEPTATVISTGTKSGGTLLTEGTNYTIAHENNTEIGTATATITGIGNYTGTVKLNYTIGESNSDSADNLIDIGEATVTIPAVTYNGTERTPDITVTYGDETLAEGTDYTASYDTAKDAGSTVVTITGTGDYTGTAKSVFYIRKLSLGNNTTLSLSSDTYTYTGSEITPAMTLTVNSSGVVLTEGVDYTVTYTTNINVGQARIHITGIGSCSGSEIKIFTIVSRSISDAEVTMDQDYYEYTGEAVKPSFTVTVDGNVLTENTDYKVTYENNVEIGTATATISACGGNTGSITVEFSIVEGEHVYDDGTVISEATCTEDGEILYTCQICGETHKETIAATGHDYDTDNPDWSWSDDYGTATVTFTCKNDDTHTYSLTADITRETTNATCTESGQTVYTAKAVYNSKEYTDTRTVPIEATGHDYDVENATVTWSDDYSTATISVPCTNDTAHVYTETVKTTPKVTKEPTCTDTGWIQYEAQFDGLDYGESISVQLDALGHSYDAPSYIWAKDYSSVTATFTCSVCGDVQSVTVEDITESITPATCEEDGLTTYSAALTFNGTVYTPVASDSIAAAGHDYDEGVVTTEATCTEDGILTYTCKNDSSHTYTEPIAATGHTAGEAVIENEVAATCTEAGSYDTVVYCAVYGAELSRETTTIPATGHSYESVVTAPTCTEGGYTTYTCSVCGDSYTADATEATGHTYGDAVWTWSDDYSSASVSFTCTSEDDAQTYEAAVSSTQIAATAEADGSITYTASYTDASGKTYTDEITISVKYVEAQENADLRFVIELGIGDTLETVIIAGKELSAAEGDFEAITEEDGSVTVVISEETVAELALEGGSTYSVDYTYSNANGEEQSGTTAIRIDIADTNEETNNAGGDDNNNANDDIIGGDGNNADDDITGGDDDKTEGTSDDSAAGDNDDDTNTGSDANTGGDIDAESQTKADTVIYDTPADNSGVEDSATTASKTQTIKIKNNKKTIKYKKLKKKAQTFKLKATVKDGAKVTFTKLNKKSSKALKNGSKYLKINKKTGKITVKKGTPKGTYKIKVNVTAKATTSYEATTRTVTITVKVK